MDPSRRSTKEQNPRETSSLLSIATFLYNLPLFKKGRKKDLDDGDVYQIPNWLSSNKLGDTLEDEWLRERRKKKEKSSLLLTLIRCFGKEYIFLGFMQLAVSLIVVFIQPKALSKVVAYFAPNQKDVTKQDLYLYSAAMIGLNLCHVIYKHNYEQLITEVGIKVRTSVAALIFRKAVRLGPNAWNQVSVGKIVTLITKDVFSFDNAVTYINDMWVGIIQTVIITCIIFSRIQWSVFAGIGFYVMTIPLQLYVGRIVTAKRVMSAKRTDERLQLTTETIRNIKTIKMYTWEDFFSRKLNEFRKLELKYLSPVYYMKSVVLIVGSTATNLSFFFIIMMYVWTGHFTDAETVYFIQNCYHNLRSFITISIPIGISQCSDAYAAVKRLTNFLNLEESKQTRSYGKTPRVFMKHVSVKLQDKDILKDVSMSIEKGLHLITGHVGSGKSAIIKALLGEYPINSGQMEVDGTVSYASEEAWLFPSTVRQNILFGMEYDEKRYNEVLKVCALTPDLKRLKYGDQTIVGDRGYNFSKGQQARINLARAVYRISDIYLIDDCLSGLDSQVNLYVFKKCIKEFLKDKIVIMVTNNINHIKLLYGNNTIYVDNGETLSLEKQREALDKRITYYIDDTEMNYFDDNDNFADSDLQDEADENTHLLIEEIQRDDTNLYHEDKKPGQVKFRVYFRYFKHAGGVIMFFILGIIFVGAQAAMSYSEKVVSFWVNNEPTVTQLIQANKTETEEYSTAIHTRNRYLGIYCGIILAMVVLIFIRIYMNFFFALRASRIIHKKMSVSVVNAFMSFFDNHLAGNVVNRFSKDLMTMDDVLPINTYEIFRQTFAFIGIMYLIISVNTLFLIPCTMLVVKLYFVQRFYLRTGRGMKRLDAATRSPMLGYLNATLDGLPIVRAYDKEILLTSEFDEHQNHFTSASYMLLCTTRFYAFILDLVSNLFCAAVILKFVLFDSDTQAGDVGLAITQAISLTGLLPWVIKQYTDLENNMTGIERVLEYADIKTENKQEGQIIKKWPSTGEIKYDNVSLTYKTTPHKVLNNISFTVKSKEKIGIVGRTGAGKSSIISVLFRLYDIEGHIFIDNVDTNSLSLEFLRSSIAIIPQDPILFSGTIRSNLDPNEKRSDEEIWTAMEKVNLKTMFHSLDEEIVKNGSRYSSGQRQLICLARALVSKNKIIVLDEATSNMDPETCRLLQTTIQDNFSDCTVLTIAHRLNTVMDCDRVMVVDHGEILEFDTPLSLLSNEHGLFYNMVKYSGLQES